MDEAELAIRASELDAPPSNGLDDIFVLPEELASNERIQRWYNEMASQLQREAQGIPMKAAQYALMERICYTYAYMRFRELTNTNLNERERQANQNAWQKMLDQFNRLLEKHNDKIVQEMVGKVFTVINEALELVEDEVTKATLRRRFSEGLANIDL